jgi:hypothetical protein
MNIEIKCEKCEEYQDQKKFFRKKISEGKYEYIEKKCKKCYCLENGQSKQCYTCDEIKNVTEYQTSKANSDGLSCYCKNCMKIKRDKERDEKKINIDPNIGKIKCTKCERYLKSNIFFKKLTKEIEEFLIYLLHRNE